MESLGFFLHRIDLRQYESQAVHVAGDLDVVTSDLRNTEYFRRRVSFAESDQQVDKRFTLLRVILSPGPRNTDHNGMGVVFVGVVVLVEELHGLTDIGLLGHEAMSADGIMVLGNLPAVINDDKIDLTHF